MNNQRLMFLDGAMGTMLQRQGLPLGEIPELLCLTDPARVTGIHREYVEAGAGLIYTNTFGANRFKLAGSGYSVAEVVAAAVGCARDACRGTDARVAVSAGSCGKLMAPAGTMTFEECYDVYREIAEAAQDAGADCIVFETMMDLAEARCAVLAAKENTALPVFATMTYEAGGRTFLGCDVRAMGLVLEGVGADAIGINCSLGPDQMLPVMQALAESTSLPLILKLNAGLPDPQTGEYSLSPEEYVTLLEPYLDLGVAFLGGCCGTSPDYIRALSRAYRGRQVRPNKPSPVPRVCSARQVTALDRVRVVGERINPTGKKRFQQALREGDLDYILAQAVAQADGGGDILDVNVGIPLIDEGAMMARVVDGLQSVTDLPLQIDSSDPEAIRRGLRQFCGKAIVNSVNGDPEVLERVLPIVKQYGACVIGLCTDKSGVPASAQARVEIARRILDAALRHGIPRENVLIDCLVMTVSAQQDQARETLSAVERVKTELGLRTVLGVSNISFGLPERERVNAAFLAMALERGLDLPILNPNNSAMMGTVRAFAVLHGEDKGAAEFLAAYAGAEPEKKRPAGADAAPKTIDEIVEKGLRAQARTAVQGLLETEAPMDIIQDRLIPALDRVGQLFEQGKLFLPQLMNAAETAQVMFEAVKAHIAQKGAAAPTGEKILIATVQGDIHDIGKNIAKCILENYGYQVIDLGRDVPIDTVAETAAREGVRLVGLSALMTTTLPNMEKTIAAIHARCPGCRVFAAGAVLTPEYAAAIGADDYARDAKQSADIAKKVLSQNT